MSLFDYLKLIEDQPSYINLEHNWVDIIFLVLAAPLPVVTDGLKLRSLIMSICRGSRNIGLSPKEYPRGTLLRGSLRQLMLK